jgi:hypothetical protein
MRETDLYPPLRDHLEAQGYTVRSEVQGCDLTAIRDGELVVVELKQSITAGLLAQAADRQRMTDSVYVAVPPPKRTGKAWRKLTHLLKRLELGLIVVDSQVRPPSVRIEFHPVPYRRTKAHKRRKALLREIGGRSADYNQAGAARTQVVTAYRERAIHIAVCLERFGPCTTKRLRELGTGPKTTAICYANVYGWFERTERATYALSNVGREALAHYPELVAHFGTGLGFRASGSGCED